MAKETVFLFKSHEGLGQHTVAEVDSLTANKLKDEGKAISVTLGEYDAFNAKAKQVFKSFKSAEESFKNSTNPYYVIPEVKEYEYNKIKDDFVAQSKAIQEEWNTYREQAVEGARIKSAQATINVTESDRLTAEQVAGRFELDFATTTNEHDLSALVNKYGINISRLTDGQKVAMQTKIANMVAKINDKAQKLNVKVTSEVYDLINEAKDVRNMDLLAEKVAEQLPYNVTHDYNTTRIVRKWSS